MPLREPDAVGIGVECEVDLRVLRVCVADAGAQFVVDVKSTGLFANPFTIVGRVRSRRSSVAAGSVALEQTSVEPATSVPAVARNITVASPPLTVMRSW